MNKEADIAGNKLKSYERILTRNVINSKLLGFECSKTFIGDLWFGTNTSRQKEVLLKPDFTQKPQKINAIFFDRMKLGYRLGPGYSPG